jgi:hypothetical protein
LRQQSAQILHRVLDRFRGDVVLRGRSLAQMFREQRGNEALAVGTLLFQRFDEEPQCGERLG